jgi:hypothetical protein
MTVRASTASARLAMLELERNANASKTQAPIVGSFEAYIRSERVGPVV